MALNFKSKKGTIVFESILVISMLFVLGIAGLLINNVFDELNDDIQSDSTISNTSKNFSQSIYDRTPKIMDSVFIFVFVLLWGMVIVASFSIDSHPVFFIFSVILIIFSAFIGMELAKYYDEMANDEDFSSYSPNYPMTNFVFDHFLGFILAMGFSVLIVLYGKSRI